MKKLYFLLLIWFSSLSLFSQVGVNTTSPNTSLDVQASRNSNGIIDNTQFFGIQAPRITRAELTNYTGSYGPDQNGALIYINDISGGNALASSPREFVTGVGYYYFESSSNKWRRLTDNTNSVAASATKSDNGLTTTADNIVKLGGTLQETTKITQGTNSLVFQGTDVANNAAFNTYTNVNINTDPSNTTSPTLRVAHPINTLNPALLLSGVNNGSNLAVGQASFIGFNPNSKSGYWPIGIGAEYTNTATSQGSADFFISSSSGGTATKKFVVTNAGNVGINTVNPLETLHVNGSLQLTNELSVGGTGTTAGNVGTNGQILVSKGIGNAPAWTTADGLISTVIKSSNGLTTTADNTVKLGGTLQETTKITQGTNNFIFQGTNAADNAAFNTYTNVNINTNPSNTTNPIIRVAHPVNTINPALLLSGVNNGPNLAVGQASFIGFNPNGKSGAFPIAIGAEYINSATSQGSADFFISTSAGGNSTKKFVVTNAGNVGINTVNPLETLHVNGSLQLTNELSVGGTGTTVGNVGTSGQVLVSKGIGNAPAWATLDGLVSTTTKSSNGLTTTADNTVKLGGTLLETTNITQGANNFVFQGTVPAANAAFNTYTNVNINTNPSNTTNPTIRVAHPVNTTNPALLLSGVNNGPNLAVGQASIMGFNPNSKSGTSFPIAIGAEYINSAASQASADFFISTSSGGAATKKFVVTNAGNVGINTVNPKKALHVNGGLQLTNELNVGGTATTVGSSGTNGQILVSKGAGNAPTWTTLDGLVPTKNGSVIALNGKLIVAQEIIVLMTADFTATGTPKAIGNLNNVILDNENKYTGTSTGNSFKVTDDGIYSITMNIQFTAATTSDLERPVFGIWNDTKNAWVARINDTYAGSNKIQTATLITSIKLNSQDTYSFRTVASSSTDPTRTVTIFAYSAGDTGSGPVTQVSLRRTL